MSRRGRKIEVTAAEMMTLRNPPYNLSNKEIAERLDIHYVTVLKYIGKQNPKKQPEQPKQPERLNGKVWDTARSVTRLESGDRAYIVDVRRQIAEIECGSTVLDAESVHRMINELTYIEQLFNKAKEEGIA